MSFINRYGRSVLLTAALAVGSVWVAGCSKKPSQESSAPESAGASAVAEAAAARNYKTAVIGGKTWMAENLDIETGVSWCYGDADSNCAKYGRLYDWNTAVTACPEGWRLPDRLDWDDLAKAAGGKAGGKALKADTGWAGGGNGADYQGFSAMPGGARAANGGFGNLGDRGVWWVIDEYDSDSAFYRRMGHNYDYVYEGTFGKGNGFSVRCVQVSDTSDSFIDKRDGKTYKTAKIGNMTWMAKNLNYKTEDSWCYGDSKKLIAYYDGTKSDVDMGSNTPSNAEIQANCAKYGRLYTWHGAMAGARSSDAMPSGVRGVCPEGWHLPSDQEWDELAKAAGGKRIRGEPSNQEWWDELAEAAIRSDYSDAWKGIGKKLKTTQGWGGANNGTNDYGFSALPAGGGHTSYTFPYGGIGECGKWWTATLKWTDASSIHYGLDEKAYAIKICGNYMVEETDYVENQESCAEEGDTKSLLSVRCVKDDIDSDTTPMRTVTVISKWPGVSGGGKYAEGARVIISAGTAPADQYFKDWTVTSGGVKLDSANIQRTAFIMPATDVTVTANTEKLTVQPGTFTDSRDGKTYKTTAILKQTWMAENLAYAAKGSKCDDDKPANCAKYGRLYGWKTAKRACPTGWRLPTDEEWMVLTKIAYDGKLTRDGCDGTVYWNGAGTKLKTKSGLNDDQGEGGNGTDDFGFSALPGGAYWWSSTLVSDNDCCIYNYSLSGRFVVRSEGDRFIGNNDNNMYVRCLKD